MRPPAREKGFALLAVMWAAAMLAIIVASLLTIARTEAFVAHGKSRTADLEATADAAMNQAILTMLDQVAAARPRTDGVPFAIVFGGRTIRVSVQDEAGKIDLNMATGDLLTRILEVGGLAAGEARVMAARIQDWREPGDLHRLRGAGQAAYRDAGIRYAPRRGPFPNVAELQLVLGMDPAVFARIAPSLTVASGTPWVDPTYAAHDVLLALPGATEASVAAALAARRTAARPGVVVGHAYTITAETVDGDEHMVRRAVIRLTGGHDVPVWVYAWERWTGP
jgi:general secretion pathway protein K